MISVSKDFTYISWVRGVLPGTATLPSMTVSVLFIWLAFASAWSTFQRPAFAADDEGWQEITRSSELVSVGTQGAPLVPVDQAVTAPVSSRQSSLPQEEQFRDPGLRDRVLAMQTVDNEPVIATPEIIEIEPKTDTTISDDELLSGETANSLMSISKLDMFVGELKVIGKVEVTRVAIGNGGIVRAELLDTGELLLIAQGEGSSSLRLWHSDGTQSGYNIRVSANDPDTRFRMERMVRLRVRMVEFRKSAIGELGIKWSETANGPAFGAAGDLTGNNLFRPEFDGFSGLPNQVDPFSTFFGIATNITSSINFLANNGDAVTLAEPVLSAINGGSASFLAGGEVPYPAQGSDGQIFVEFKQYGIRLEVAPRIDNAGNVRTFVQTEISEVDESLTVAGAPGLLTRRAETEVNVRSGETIVISGLLSADNSVNNESVPGLGRIPILGHLFKSKSTNDGASELVIFVTPEVVEPEESPLMDERESEIFAETSKEVQSIRGEPLTPLLME